MARRHDASVPLLPLLPLADPRGDANPIKNEVYNIIRRRMGRDKKGGGKRREGGREGGKGGGRRRRRRRREISRTFRGLSLGPGAAGNGAPETKDWSWKLDCPSKAPWVSYVGTRDDSFNATSVKCSETFPEAAPCNGGGGGGGGSKP